MCHVYVDMYNVAREYKHTGNYANRCAHMSCGLTSHYTCEDDSDRSSIRAIFERLVVTLLVHLTHV